jgi:DapF: diaminopimelate epimerase
LQSNSVQRDL